MERSADILEYTVDVQVSDYFTFEAVVLDDSFSDGQTFLASFAPTYTVVENGVTTSGTFASTHFTVVPNTDGTTDVQFRLSNQLIALGQNGWLDGDFRDRNISVGWNVRSDSLSYTDSHRFQRIASNRGLQCRRIRCACQ